MPEDCSLEKDELREELEGRTERLIISVQDETSGKRADVTERYTFVGIEDASGGDKGERVRGTEGFAKVIAVLDEA